MTICVDRWVGVGLFWGPGRGPCDFPVRYAELEFGFYDAQYSPASGTQLDHGLKQVCAQFQAVMFSVVQENSHGDEGVQNRTPALTSVSASKSSAPTTGLAQLFGHGSGLVWASTMRCQEPRRRPGVWPPSPQRTHTCLRAGCPGVLHHIWRCPCGPGAL